MNKYALMLENDEELFDDKKEEIVNYYKKAIEDGNPDALYNYANMLR